MTEEFKQEMAKVLKERFPFLGGPLLTDYTPLVAQQVCQQLEYLYSVLTIPKSH